jgi:hypothetical protein
LVDRLATPRAALAVTSLLASLLLVPVPSSAGDDEPAVTLSDAVPQDPRGASNETSPTPRQVLAADTGAIAGVVVRDCGGSALAGCQGQGIPNLQLRVRRADGAFVASVRTSSDGAFWAAVPPGSYVIQDENLQLSVPVDVRTGEVTQFEISIPPQ